MAPTVTSAEQIVRFAWLLRGPQDLKHTGTVLLELVTADEGYRLSPQQQRLWSLRTSGPGEYLAQCAVPAMTFPVQVIADAPEVLFEQAPASGPAAERKVWDRLLAAHRRQPFDLAAGPPGAGHPGPARRPAARARDHHAVTLRRRGFPVDPAALRCLAVPGGCHQSQEPWTGPMLRCSTLTCRSGWRLVLSGPAGGQAVTIGVRCPGRDSEDLRDALGPLESVVPVAFGPAMEWDARTFRELVRETGAAMAEGWTWTCSR